MELLPRWAGGAPIVDQRIAPLEVPAGHPERERLRQVAGSKYRVREAVPPERSIAAEIFGRQEVRTVGLPQVEAG